MCHLIERSLNLCADYQKKKTSLLIHIMSPPIAYLSRIAYFSSAHRLHSPYLTEEENQITYGKCNNKYGHGHNYKLKVTLKGPVNKNTGMIMNINDLKHCIQLAIIDKLDHRHLNEEVDYFKEYPSTTENLAIFIWNQLKQELRKTGNEDILYEIELWETEYNSVIYRGE
jgi:6-pyruvoyltetrahydropterin/6-carboxytetrahydropterin synthase